SSIFVLPPTLWSLFFALCSIQIDALHLEGYWKPHQQYLFLAKFGFQRTRVDELVASRGYIYGNVKLLGDDQIGLNGTTLATLVLVDSEFIIGLYGNATEPVGPQNISGLSLAESAWLVETERCRRMFAMIDAIAWHRTCAPNGQMDLLRAVPCPSSHMCAEEDNADRVIGRSQFTYTVQDLRQPRYWYLSLVACRRNPTTCEWETTSVVRPGSPNPNLVATTLSYSVWFVNGAPHLQGFNQFEHQFSFEAHDTAEIFLVFLVLYLVLVALVHIQLSSHCVVHARLFLVFIWLSILGTLLTTIHLGVFSFDGRGLGHMFQFGTLVSEWADSLFLVLLLSTAEMGFTPEHFECYSLQNLRARASPTGRKRSGSGGSDKPYAYHRLAVYKKQWHPTQDNEPTDLFDPARLVEQNLKKANPAWPFLTCLGTLFLSVKTTLYVWASFDQDPVIDFYVWNTVPGCILLAVRFGVAFWFLAILRRRQLDVNAGISDDDLSAPDYLGPGIDLVHFAAGFLLWMFVLPLVVFVAETSVSSLWRYKTIISEFLSMLAIFNFCG
ncbi:hypothetical protein P879_10421, partial [Paragonimus westermani]